MKTYYNNNGWAMPADYEVKRFRRENIALAAIFSLLITALASMSAYIVGSLC